MSRKEHSRSEILEPNGRRIIVNLPSPYRDELLYSVVCRLCLRTGWNSATISKRLLGGAEWCNVDICGRLDELAANFSPALPLTADDILNRLTLFPFYAAGASRTRSAEIADRLKRGSGHHAHAAFGILAQSVKRSDTLRFCPACRDDDLETLGETYWRRAHQLPGVVACAWHPTMLVASDVACKYMNASGHRDATSATAEFDVPPTQLEHRQVERAHEVAARCADLLDIAWNEAVLPLAFQDAKELARIKGLLGAWGGIDHPKIAQHIIAFYGADLLNRMGLGAEPSPIGELYWVKKLFVNFHHNVFPTTGIILSVALDALPNVHVPPDLFVRSKGKPPRAPREGEIDIWRAKWEWILESAAPPKVTNARASHCNLATSLRHWDHEWYLATNAKYRTLRASNVDMAAREADVVAALSKAEREMRSRNDGPRRTKLAITERAQVKRGWLYNLPAAITFLNQHAESLAAYHARRLRRAADAILDDGRQPTPTGLSLMARMGYDAVTSERNRELVAALCRLRPEDRTFDGKKVSAPK